MQETILKARTDEGSGELGFAIEGLDPALEHSAAIDGLLIAHDLIEHQNGPGSIGPIIDEMEALGAIWFVRGCTGELRRDSMGSRYSIQENLASDFSLMFRDSVWNDDSLVVALPSAPLDNESDDSELEYIVEIAQKQAVDELEDLEPEELENSKERIAEYWAACLPAMREGYRKAEKRFGNTEAANAQFWAIAEAVNPYLKGVDYEGQELKLTWGEGRAYCEEHFDDDDFDDDED